MTQIQHLFVILSVVMFLNAITFLYDFWPSKHLEKTPKTEEVTWTWKETIWIIIICFSLIVCILCLIWFDDILPEKIRRWVSGILTASFLMKYVSKTIPSAEIIESVVRKDSGGRLSIKEHLAILLFAIIFCNLNNYNIPEKILGLFSALPNQVLGDWMIIAFYFFLIAMCTFLISSLAVSPIQFILGLLQRKAAVIPLSPIKSMESNVSRILNGNLKTETIVSKLIDFSRTRHNIIKPLLWCIAPFAIICDILYYVLQFVFSILVSLLWYCYLTAKNILLLISKFGRWVVSLSNKAIVAFSFRISIIWGIVYTVAINRYSPIVYFKEESTALLEFISSTIVIPIIIEWVLSAKKGK